MHSINFREPAIAEKGVEQFVKKGENAEYFKNALLNPERQTERRRGNSNNQQMTITSLSAMNSAI